MAPYFIRNLIPRRDQRTEGRPLLEALASLTLVQWGLFWSGYVCPSMPIPLAHCPPPPPARPSPLLDRR